MRIYTEKNEKYFIIRFKAVKELPMFIKSAWYTKNRFFSLLIEDKGLFVALTIYK
jgi:hypothetical protein